MRQGKKIYIRAIGDFDESVFDLNSLGCSNSFKHADIVYG